MKAVKKSVSALSAIALVFLFPLTLSAQNDSTAAATQDDLHSQIGSLKQTINALQKRQDENEYNDTLDKSGKSASHTSTSAISLHIR